MAQAAPRHPQHHRHAAAPAVAVHRRVVDELIEPGRDEVVELHLADGPLTRQRRPDAHAEYAAFGDRRIDDAIAELLDERPQEQERVPVTPAHVLAVDEHAGVGAQCVADAEHHRVEERAAFRVERRRLLNVEPTARGARTAGFLRGLSGLCVPCT